MSAFFSLIAMSLLLAACGGPMSNSLEAAALCQSVAGEYGADFVVAAAFDTTMERVRALDPLPGTPQRLPTLAPDEPAVVCFLDGPIPKSPPPGPAGEVPESFDRAVVVVVDGHHEMILAGYQRTLPVRQP